MNIRIFTLQQSEEWSQALKRFQNIDVYFLPEYHRAYAVNGDGTALAFAVEEGDNLLFYPFLLRPLPAEAGEEMDGDWYDIETVYGYSGPLSTSNNSSFLARAWLAFSAFCADARIVAEFIRFNPGLGNQWCADKSCNVSLDRETVAVKLDCSSDLMWKSYSSIQRNMVTKAIKRGLVCEEVSPELGLGDFLRLYRETMSRNGAAEYYSFSDAMFHTVFEDLGAAAKLFQVRKAAEVIASAIFLLGEDRIHYHLSGSDARYKDAANNLLLHHAASWGAQNGFKVLHLGGGRTPRADDGLFRFKASISKLRLPFYTGRRIHNESVYESLCEGWMRRKMRAVRPDYFLLYRLEKSNLTPNLSELPLCSQDCSIRDAMAIVDRCAKGIALIVDADGRLISTLTDGDIRRAILSGTDLDLSVDAALTTRDRQLYPEPTTAPVGTSEATLLHMMTVANVRHIPLLDNSGRVVDLAVLNDLVKDFELPLQAVIMAGGYGTRLRPLTDDLPKPMLPVGDRPLLERLVEQLRDAGIRRLNLTTHYKKEVIKQHFGDGQGFGVDIQYVNEDHPLGTAGALSKLNGSSGPLLVLNGDIVTQVDFRAMLDFHREHDADMTVGVREYEVKIPYGVIESNGAIVTGISEKPTLRQFINAGIYLLNPEVCRFVPDGRRYDMTQLIDRLIGEGYRLVCFPIREYWLDIGQQADYKKAQEYVTRNGEGRLRKVAG